MGWQVQSRRPEEAIAGNETDEFRQRRFIQIACLLEWAWFKHKRRPGPSRKARLILIFRL
jgi:hypothetical protein